MENKKLVSVTNMKQHFSVKGKKIKAVDRISFDIYEGETLGLVGESGSGKSTTGRSLIGLYEITSGQIEFDGKLIMSKLGRGDQKKIVELKSKKKSDLTKAEIDHLNDLIKLEKEQIKSLNKKGKKELANEMQMIFQDPFASVNPRLNVEEIIAEGLKIHYPKLTRKQRQDKIGELLETVGLNREHMSRYPHEFSGGQLQRVGIARALAVKPKFIIADEAISALDVSIQAQVVNLMKKLQREFGLTYLFIAHDLSMVQYISDRIAVMHQGKIVELAPKDKLYKNPVHPYTKSLMSAIPQPDPESEKTRQRIIYDPNMHDYENANPKLREISEGHFIYCSEEELAEYIKTY